MSLAARCASAWLPPYRLCESKPFRSVQQRPRPRLRALAQLSVPHAGSCGSEVLPDWGRPRPWAGRVGCPYVWSPEIQAFPGGEPARALLSDAADSGSPRCPGVQVVRSPGSQVPRFPGRRIHSREAASRSEALGTVPSGDVPGLVREVSIARGQVGFVCVAARCSVKARGVSRDLSMDPALAGPAPPVSLSPHMCLRVGTERENGASVLRQHRRRHNSHRGMNA